jgi:hypothetical protein
MAATTKVENIKKTIADSAALAAWVTDLATDITAGKVIGFTLDTTSEDGYVQGTLVRPAPTDLTVAVEDA